MEYPKLEKFSKKNHSEISKIISREFISIEGLLEDLQSTKNRQKKLYETSKDISKIIDLYDEKNKINLNREEYTIEFMDRFSESLPNELSEQKINDYKEVFKIIVSKTLEFDDSNWNNYYNNILKSAEYYTDNKINKNILYNYDYEDLTPKKLVEIYQRNINDEMIEGGSFSYQSDTQEMVAIINEFVIDKGCNETLKYLEQGENNSNKLTELLKEVNAVSLVEPFTFKGDKPSFKKASSGQFDGFILQKDSAKVILATKNENTNIERDSLFRHFITAMVIKKKIDETEPNQDLLDEKKKAWLSYYQSEKNLEGFIKEILSNTRSIKIDGNMPLDIKDFYIDKEFYNTFEDDVKYANTNGLYQIRIKTKNKHNVPMIETDTIDFLFGKDRLKASSGVIQIGMDEAELLLEKIKKLDLKTYYEKFANELLAIAEDKVTNKKFREQILLDTKKETMVEKNGYLSIKNMIADYNRNTKAGLVELGIFTEKDSFDELGFSEMEKINAKAKELNVDLIYFGSVSDKKSALPNEYDRDFTNKEYKNKEYRYGLNLLAYSNLLSSVKKDNFKMTTDASLLFVNNVNLRAITKIKKDGFDLDLEKINEKGFIKDVIYITYKSMYENALIENDSIDFFENFLNATNVLISDFMEDYKVDLEDEKNSKIEESFNKTMKYQTGRKNEDFDLVKTVRSLKSFMSVHSKKIANVSLIDALDLRLNEIIKSSDSPEMTKILEDYPIHENEKNKNIRKIRRR